MDAKNLAGVTENEANMSSMIIPLICEAFHHLDETFLP
jgi:hypothetical protein